MPNLSKAKNRISYLAALCRHFGIRGTEFASRVRDFANGFMNFLVWVPSVLGQVAKIRARTYQRSGGKLYSSRDKKFEGKMQVVFINLDTRPDRRRQTESELEGLGISDPRRFRAIRDNNGALGCARSHLNVISKFSSDGDELLMVCEDDIEIVSSRNELFATVADFEIHPELDVLCLGFRLRAPRLPITQHLAIANGVQTTLCYVVKAQAAPTLVRSFQRSEEMLLRGESLQKASIDQQWKREQSRELMFCVPRKNLIHHRTSFSDITGRVKDYDPGTRLRRKGRS